MDLDTERGLDGGRHYLRRGRMFEPCVLAPTSRGSVTLRSPNPESAPPITHNYLTTDADLAIMVAENAADLIRGSAATAS